MDSEIVSGLTELLASVVTIDLFDAPQRERIREEAVRLETKGTKPPQDPLWKLKRNPLLRELAAGREDVTMVTLSDAGCHWG